MKLIGTIHRFNTGRLYTSTGQEIVWGIVERSDHTKVVAFFDTARMIDGVIKIHVGNLDLITDRWVLRAYDDFHYYHESQEVALIKSIYYEDKK